MNRIDRLFAILLTLQHKRRVRAQDLARQFEISRRTIYRDMSALNRWGFPSRRRRARALNWWRGFTSRR
ncbi:MAG: HTH domain-containing protein [Chloroflexi bacterium]|nr:HTH domain-containing protein [Chloroflexota bacterium]